MGVDGCRRFRGAGIGFGLANLAALGSGCDVFVLFRCVAGIRETGGFIGDFVCWKNEPTGQGFSWDRGGSNEAGAGESRLIVETIRFTGYILFEFFAGGLEISDLLEGVRHLAVEAMLAGTQIGKGAGVFHKARARSSVSKTDSGSVWPYSPQVRMPSSMVLMRRRRH